MFRHSSYAQSTPDIFTLELASMPSRTINKETYIKLIKESEGGTKQIQDFTEVLDYC